MVQVRESDWGHELGVLAMGLPQEPGLLEDKLHHAITSSTYPRGQRLAGSCWIDRFSLYERLLILNLLLPLLCIGFKRQPFCFWDIQPDSHQTVASSKNHKNLPQGPDLLYGAGEGDEVFPSSVPGPSEVTMALSIQILATYCQRRHKERCHMVLRFQFLENNHR